MFRALCFVAIFQAFIMAEQNLDSNIDNIDSAKSSQIDTAQLVKIFTQPEEGEITAINNDKNGLSVKVTNLSLVVGESGFIVRDLGSYESVIASVDVIKVDGSSAICKVREFREL